MSEPHPGVRRLCVAAAGPTCLLTSACESARLGRLCVTLAQRDGMEMAFAPPGIDEVALVTRLITALRHLAARGPDVGRPALTAFHVGITRVEGEGFGGEAALRTRALVLNSAIRATAIDSGRRLALIISDGLYADLRAEGMPGQDWRHIPAAGAWMRCCEARLPDPQGRGYPSDPQGRGYPSDPQGRGYPSDPQSPAYLPDLQDLDYPSDPQGLACP